MKINKPLDSWDTIPTSSPYGWRTDPFTKIPKFHGGIDKSGANHIVKAAKGGVVTFYLPSSGQMDITSTEGSEKIKCCYAHMKNIPAKIRLGATIAQGEVIGVSDSMGKVTGPCLHFGVYDFKTGKWENPSNYFGNINPSKYELKKVGNNLVMTSINTNYAGYCYTTRGGRTSRLWIDTRSNKADRTLILGMDKLMYEVDWAYVKKSFDNR